MRIVLFVGLLLVASACTNKKKLSAQQQTAVVKLAPAEFESKFSTLPGAQLVDVRTPEEFQSGYIKGAININYQGDKFEEEVAKLDKTKPVFVYCRSGGRSSESANYMANKGFKEIYDLDGGITRWNSQNKPVEQVVH